MTATFAKPFMAMSRKANAFGQAESTEQIELANKLNEEARKEWDNPAFHRQVAQDVSSFLDYGFTFGNSFSDWILTERVGEFDRVHLTERRGLKVYHTARGGYINESQLTTEKWEVPRDTLGFHVSEFEDKMRAGFATAISDIVSLGQARLEAEVNRRVFSMLQAAVPVGSPNHVGVAGITKTVVDAAIRDVKDAIRPDGVQNVPVTIIGRAAVVDQISDFPGFGWEALEEIRMKGRLGTYRGANIVSLQHYADEDGLSFLPANELWVFGGTVGKFVRFGGLLTKTWIEDTVDYYHSRTRCDVGGLINKPEQSRRIVDSTVTP